MSSWNRDSNLDPRPRRENGRRPAGRRPFRTAVEGGLLLLVHHLVVGLDDAFLFGSRARTLGLRLAGGPGARRLVRLLRDLVPPLLQLVHRRLDLGVVVLLERLARAFDRRLE